MVCGVFNNCEGDAGFTEGCPGPFRGRGETLEKLWGDGPFQFLEQQKSAQSRFASDLLQLAAGCSVANTPWLSVAAKYRTP